MADELFRHFITQDWLCQGKGRSVELTVQSERVLLQAVNTTLDQSDLVG